MPEDESSHLVDRPLALRFHILEFAEGQGMAGLSGQSLSWTGHSSMTCGPPRCSVEFITWNQGWLDPFMIEPVQHPASRGYDVIGAP